MASGFSVQVSGMDAVFSGLDTQVQAIHDKVDQLIQYAGLRCQALAKQYCPVDTGRLRASIQYAPGILQCTVGTDVIYAIYVENGTFKMRAQPFLNPAFQQALLELVQELNSL